MSLSLSVPVYQWLTRLDILNENSDCVIGNEKSDLVSLTTEATEKFTNGTSISRLLHRLGEIKQIESSFSFLNRPDSSAYSRAAFCVYNWTHIVEDLRAHEISLSQDMKSLIFAGDLQVLSDLLQEIHQKAESGNEEFGNNKNLGVTLEEYLQVSKVVKNEIQEQIQQSAPIEAERFMEKAEAIVEDSQVELADNEIKQTTPVKELEMQNYSAFETLLLDGMREFFSFSAKQSLKVLSGQNEPLREIFISGINEEFDQVVAWLKHVYMALSKFPEGNKEFSKFFLNLMLPGLDSNHAEVVHWVCRILTSFNVNNNFADFIENWFTSSCLKKLTNCVCQNTNKDLSSVLASVFFVMGKNLQTLVDVHVPLHLPEPLVQLQFYSKLILHVQSNFRSEIELQRAVSILLDFAYKNANKETNELVVEEGLQLCTTIWANFPQIVEKLDSKPEKIVSLLRKKCKKTSKAIAICCVLCMFQLLEVLIKRRDTLASQLYKGLVFIMIESRGDQPLRNLITANFSVIMKKLHTIPPQIVVEPLVREISYEGYSNFDLEFIATVSNHPRLPLKHGLLLAHMLGKIAINDPVFARLAMLPFLTLIARFNTKPLMQDYVEKYCKVAVSMFLKSVERIYTANTGENGIDTNKIRKQLSLEIVQKISQLKIPIYAQRMKPSIEVVSQEYQRIYRETHPILEEVKTSLRRQMEKFPELQAQGRPNQNPFSAQTLSELPVEVGESGIPSSSQVHSEAHPSCSLISSQSANIPPPLHTSVSAESGISRQPPSKTEQMAQKLIQETKEFSNYAPSDQDDYVALCESAHERQKNLEELTRNHEIEIARLRMEHDEKMRIGQLQVMEERDQMRHDIHLKKQQREKGEEIQRKRFKELEKIKYEGLQSMTTEESNPYSPVTSQRRKRRGNKRATMKSHYALPNQTKKSPKPTKPRFKGTKGCPVWSSQVREYLTITYKRPLGRIFKAFRGKKPRAIKMRSFDDVALARQSLTTADFLYIFEDCGVIPDLLTRRDVVHISKEMGQSGGKFVTMDQFLSSIWFIAYKTFPESKDLEKVENLMQKLKDGFQFSTVRHFSPQGQHVVVSGFDMRWSIATVCGGWKNQK